MALEAAARGLVDIAQWTRVEVMDAVAQHIHSSDDDNNNGTAPRLPMICPAPAELEQLLWEPTLQREARIFPELASVERETRLRAGFQTYLDRNTYCHVHLAAVFDDPAWLRFFAQFR